jgi:hypothetical protein
VLTSKRLTLMFGPEFNCIAETFDISLGYLN